jgi:hypothetical protein
VHLAIARRDACRSAKYSAASLLGGTGINDVQPCRLLDDCVGPVLGTANRLITSTLAKRTASIKLRLSSWRFNPGDQIWTRLILSERNEAAAVAVQGPARRGNPNGY